MQLKSIIACTLFAAVAAVHANETDAVVAKAMTGLEIRVSPKPFSRIIKRMYVGLDDKGKPRTGIAIRQIEEFNSITAVVIVDKTEKGFVLREVEVPDILNMRKPDDRRQLQKLLEKFKGASFDPHAAKSAVDAMSGATRYSARMASYLNYMARHTALTMETAPDWPKMK